MRDNLREGLRKTLCLIFNHKLIEVSLMYEGEIVKKSFTCSRCRTHIEIYEYQ